MARIKRLSSHEAQKIAAGEVVERPVNAVKELIENALDAGATSITVSVNEAGKEYIRVIDSGCGMSEEDARLCFEHHATSKITSVDDLNYLMTFGFRGEALSSISSVSRVTLITRETSAQLGTKLVLEAGTVVSQESVACPVGTDITVEHLFYNVPARKKFLKTRETEWRQIVQLFQAMCLDYTKVHFKLISEGSVVFNCPAVAARKDRIVQLWDTKMAGHMLSWQAEDSDKKISIECSMSDHQYYRHDRSLFYSNDQKTPGF